MQQNKVLCLEKFQDLVESQATFLKKKIILIVWQMKSSFSIVSTSKFG